MIYLNGILNILKPPGMTSHDVVSVVRKKLNMKKVGHTGTLDPNASGVLPICVGQATKVSQFLLDSKKKYRAELTLGIETDTEDIYGEVINQVPVVSTKEEIESAILSFIGTYDQVPPMYSAVKVNGKKLYEMARNGIEIERKSRRINIYSIDIIEISGNTALFDVLCSKGTYIRTLCKDIGTSLGCGGVMSFLIRTETSGFDLSSSITIEELKELEEVEKVLLPLDYPLNHIPKIDVKPDYDKQVLNGARVYEHYLINKLDLPLETEVRIYLDNQFVGLGITKSSEGERYIKFLRLLIERK